MTTMTRSQLDQIIRRSSRFTSLGNARNCQDHRTKSSLIVLGCDGRFWVTTMADGERLVRAGYEAIA